LVGGFKKKTGGWPEPASQKKKKGRRSYRGPREKNYIQIITRTKKAGAIDEQGKLEKLEEGSVYQTPEPGDPEGETLTPT